MVLLLGFCLSVDTQESTHISQPGRELVFESKFHVLFMTGPQDLPTDKNNEMISKAFYKN
jgi:hypothetical protein